MEHVLPSRRPRSSRRLRPSRRLRSLPAALSDPRSFGRPRPQTLIVALLALLAAGGGYLWFRDSSFVAVQQVEIAGVHGPDAGLLESELSTEAKKMSTLDFNQSALQASVARYHLVRDLTVTSSFPHTMRIVVSERLPVAILSEGGTTATVAGDGTILGAGVSSHGLPILSAPILPSPGERVSEGKLRSFLTVLGAAPKPLLHLVSSIYEGREGITVKMDNGLLVYFGDDTRPHAKWASFAAVLSDPSSAGANYIDVQIPERPAAGMPEGASESSGEQVSASDPTSAALAESLQRAVSGEAIETPTSGLPVEEEAISGEAAVGGEEPAEGEAGYAGEPEPAESAASEVGG